MLRSAENIGITISSSGVFSFTYSHHLRHLVVAFLESSSLKKLSAAND
jgi:hypothetical protein